jgi:hypothetical protein
MSGYDGCADPCSNFQNVIYFSYRPNPKGGGTIENWYVDEYGEATELYDSVDVPGQAPALERYRCLACGERFYEWFDVLDHFPSDEDDEEGENADPWE